MKTFLQKKCTLLFCALTIFASTFVFATGAQETSLSKINEVLAEEGEISSTNTTQNNQGTSSSNQSNSKSILQTATNAANAVSDVLGATNGNGYTNDEAVQALKEALIESAISSSSLLSKEDAYFKNPLYFIDMPEDAEKLINVVTKVPGGKGLVDDVVLRLNRTAESSAREIVPIFRNAITTMSVEDGVALVTGGDSAATEYLKKKTYTQLLSLYKPKINSALDQKLVGKTSANEAWTKLVNAYNKTGNTTNKIFRKLGKEDVMEEIETDLAQYATEKALDAVFLQMAEEEKKIRTNPLDYASKLIQKVFGAKS